VTVHEEHGDDVVRPRSPASQGSPPRSEPSPQQVLAERYARGEIDDEEYARRRAVLDSHSKA
jgi:putative membrane protein